MEKLEEDSAAKFINALIKSVQTLCHGYLDFNNGIEIIGHINLNVDKGSSMHYILEEKVCKNEENSTLFISNSFHAQSQKSDAKSKGKDSDSQVGSKGEEKTSASDLGEAGKLSAISSISSALSKSHEKNRLGSTSSAKDSENVHSRPSSTAKRKASDDHHSNDVRAAKSSHLSSSPSPVSHFLAHSPHDPSASPSPADSKPSLRHLHSEDSGTVLPQTAAVTSDGAGDLGVNLAGSVLERVDDQSNSDLQDRGEDSDGDLEVTFIKEEYVEGEQLPCQFDNTGGQQYGRGTHQRASSSDMSDGSMFPVSLHHSQSASSTFIPSAHDMAAAQHYGPSTSGQPQPGTSGVRGNLSASQPPQPVPEGMRPGCGYVHPSDAQQWMQGRRPSQESARPLMPPPPPPPLPPPPGSLMGPPGSLVAATAGPPDIQHHYQAGHFSPSSCPEDVKPPHNFLHPAPSDSGPGQSAALGDGGMMGQNFLNVGSSGGGAMTVDSGQPPRMVVSACREDPIKRLTAMVDRQLRDPGPAVRLTYW